MRSGDLFHTEVLLSPDEPMHSHPNGELLMALEGDLIVTSDEAIRLRESEIVYINGGERHALRPVGKESLIFRCGFSAKVLKPGHYYACSSQVTAE